MIDTDCTTCDGVGTLGCDPETNERIYCDACVYGVEMHIGSVRAAMGDCGKWLRENEDAEEWYDHVTGEVWYREDIAIVDEQMSDLTERFDELSALLDTLKQDETNRPRALLFEDA